MGVTAGPNAETYSMGDFEMATTNKVTRPLWIAGALALLLFIPAAQAQLGGVNVAGPTAAVNEFAAGLESAVGAGLSTEGVQIIQEDGDTNGPGYSVSAAASEVNDTEGDCTPSATSLCLLNGRYDVTVSYSTLEGESGGGRTARPGTVDSGLFYFFNPGNWEMLVKVLDGCTFNQRHWVFAASATDLGLDLQVRDTVTGQMKQYTKDAGSAAPAVVDVSAFPDGCST